MKILDVIRWIAMIIAVIIAIEERKWWMFAVAGIIVFLMVITGII